MPYVISFYGYQPSPRYDGKPWRNARFQESANQTGPWTTLETQALSPIDSDPSSPALRNFTTSLATLATGWYRVIFIDADGSEEITPVVYRGAASDTYATLADVKRVMKLTISDTATDSQLVDALEVADALIRSKVQTFDVASGTAMHYHVTPGSALVLPVQGAAVSQVRSYLTPTATPVILLGNQFQVGKTAVLLERYLWEAPYPYGYGRTNLLYARDLVVARMEFDWTSTASVPKPVRDAVAMTAGALWSQGPKFVSGLRSETIGDYSYSFDGVGGKDKLIPSAALDLIKPWARRKRIFVT